MTKKGKDPDSTMHVPRPRASPTHLRKADPAVHAALGARLRAYYAEMAQEPVPNRFLDLLDQLDAQPPKSPDPKSGG